MVNLKFSSKQSINHIEGITLHYLPCSIRHDGKAQVSTFFEPYIIKDNPAGEKLYKYILSRFNLNLELKLYKSI